MDSHSQLPDWTPEQVGAWIRTMNLNGAYPQSFEGEALFCTPPAIQANSVPFHLLPENEISGDVLAHADHDMLKELGVLSVGHRLAILRAVYDMKIRQGLQFEEFDFVPPFTPTADKDKRIVYPHGQTYSARHDGGTNQVAPGLIELWNEISRINRELAALREAVGPVQSLARDVEILRAHIANPSLPTPYSIHSNSSGPAPFSIASGDYNSISSNHSAHSGGVNSAKSVKGDEGEQITNGTSVSPNTPTAGSANAAAASSNSNAMWSAVAGNPTLVSPGPSSPTTSSESVIVRVVGHFLQRDGEQQKYMKCLPSETTAGVVDRILKRFRIRDDGQKYVLSVLSQGTERTILLHERPLSLVPIPAAPTVISESTPTFLLRRQQAPTDAIVLHGYVPQKDGDLAVRANERVRVLSKDPAGWWYVEGTIGVGWVPVGVFGAGAGSPAIVSQGSFITAAGSSPSATSAQGSSNSSSTSQPGGGSSRSTDDEVPKGTYAIATFDYNARANNELSIKIGDRVDVVRKHGAWYLGVMGSVKGSSLSMRISLLGSN
ncbi:Adaptor for signal transduction [Gonapodya sp. JEL0774]|nr:Adaptor for signal transduction [Gonapodya sp. JEL0774]